jgi:carboxylesterase type B
LPAYERGQRATMLLDRICRVENDPARMARKALADLVEG